MAVELINPRLWFAQYHLSSDHNKASLTVGYGEQDATVFTDTAKRTNGTIPFVELTGGGFLTLGSTAVHGVLKGNLNVANVPVSVGINGGTDGTDVEFFLARALKYSYLGDETGKIAPFTWQAKGQGHPSVPGKMLGVGSKTTTANGTARQLGAVSATQKLYAVQHVISVSGTNPTLDTLITSDNAEGFSSATTRITFAQQVAAGSEWATPVAGAIADDWWRAQWTIGGTNSPTFDVVIVAGIF